jgi:putative tricarboxylic transport membrane protein
MNHAVSTHSPERRRREAALGVAVGVLGIAVGWGAARIPGDAGYGGVGPNFLPAVVALGLVACAVGLIRQAFTGGFRHAEAPSGAEQADWRSGAWMLAGLLINAGLIERVGFILACAICFVMAARGLRRAEGRASSWARTALDAALGMAIAAPTYWMFTQVLGIALPGLTSTGWL